MSATLCVSIPLPFSNRNASTNFLQHHCFLSTIKHSVSYLVVCDFHHKQEHRSPLPAFKMPINSFGQLLADSLISSKYRMTPFWTFLQCPQRQVPILRATSTPGHLTGITFERKPATSEFEGRDDFWHYDFSCTVTYKTLQNLDFRSHVWYVGDIVKTS